MLWCFALWFRWFLSAWLAGTCFSRIFLETCFDGWKRSLNALWWCFVSSFLFGWSVMDKDPSPRRTFDDAMLVLWSHCVDDVLWMMIWWLILLLGCCDDAWLPWLSSRGCLGGVAMVSCWFYQRMLVILWCAWFWWVVFDLMLSMVYIRDDEHDTSRQRLWHMCRIDATTPMWLVMHIAMP